MLTLKAMPHGMVKFDDILTNEAYYAGGLERDYQIQGLCFRYRMRVRSRMRVAFPLGRLDKKAFFLHPKEGRLF